MLRRILVRKLERLFDAVHGDDETVRDGFTDNLDTRQGKGLDEDLVFDGGPFGIRQVDGDEDDLTVSTVFGLTEKVGGDVGGVGG
jgi:hypothetical protein